MPWSDCQLQLKNINNNAVLITGQVVEGSFTMVFKQEKIILKYIKCKIVGTYKAGWSRPMPTMPFIRYYSAKEKVIEIILDVFPEYTEITLDPSTVTKEFSFFLPEDLPSSYRGSLGKVKYEIELEARANKHSKKIYKFPLTVHRKSISIDIDKLLVSTEHKFDKHTFLNGNLNIIFKTLKGFTPPQIIPFDVDIANEHNVQISNVSVALVQLVRYHSNLGYADVVKSIGSVEEQIQSNCSKISCHFHMDVSSSIIVPTSIRNTIEVKYLMEIKYEYHIQFVFPFHLNLFNKIPVIVLSS